MRTKIMLFASLLFTFTACYNDKNQKKMKEENNSALYPKGQKLPNDWFSGNAFLTPLVAKDHNNEFSAGSVTFEIGRITSYNVCYTKLLRNSQPKTIGLILAGNIPLVGFHDVLSVIISGNIAKVKLSSNDQQFVITSYSIHYTKLYDSFSVRTTASRKAPKCVPPCVVFCPFTKE